MCSDTYLYWTKEIASLSLGEKATYTYSVKVKALGLETRLEPLVVSVDGTPVSVSNDVVLYSELEGKYNPQPSESKFPTIPVVVAIVVVAIIIASAFIIRSRKKKAA